MPEITKVSLGYSVSPQLSQRAPKGIGISPYSLASSVRYGCNVLTNGLFSHPTPRHTQPLSEKGITQLRTHKTLKTPLKIIFLGDIMLSNSGYFPEIDAKTRQLLQSADIIVANVESPVVQDSKNKHLQRKGASLSFEMPNTYLNTLYKCNETAKWVMSIANNHACDGGKEGITRTAQAIKTVIPNVEIIGAHTKETDTVLSLKYNGFLMAFVAWSEVMNHDHKHIALPITRREDLSPSIIKNLKANHDLVIGFPHGNEEQSTTPTRKTRKDWLNLTKPQGFDMIVGHGPHIPQLGEKNRKALVVHSLGNFYGPRGPSNTDIGAIFSITLNGRKAEYETHLIHFNKKQETISSLKKKEDTYFQIRRRFQWNSESIRRQSKKISSCFFQTALSMIYRTLPIRFS